MTTTLVRDSIVGDDWIKRTAQAVPVQRIVGEDGQPTGDILTGPVRLAFENLFELPEKQGDSEPKYGATLLFTPLADFKIFYEEYYLWCGREFPTYYEPTSQQYHGLHSPFHDQAEKAAKYGGYTPGSVYITSSSQYKPPVVDTRYNPIVDKTKVYPGVWAICAVRPYAYGKNAKGPQKKGIGFGLQSVMLIGDDTRHGGGAPNPKSLFQGVNVAAPVVRPDIGAGMPQGAAPPPPAGIPGYTAPAHNPAAPVPQVPQTHFTPPGAPSASPGYPPGNPSAPPVTTYPSDDNDMSFLG